MKGTKTMRRFVMMIGAWCVAASMATAAPLVTPCSGSWDEYLGEYTTCEVYGRPADAVGGPFDLSLYLPTWSLERQVTSYDQTNVFDIVDGALYYVRYTGYTPYISGTPETGGQFAYWHFDTYSVVGIEDLGYEPGEASDWDYNDFVVRFERLPVPDVPVPEPVTVALLTLGVAGVLRRSRR